MRRRNRIFYTADARAVCDLCELSVRHDDQAIESDRAGLGFLGTARACKNTPESIGAQSPRAIQETILIYQVCGNRGPRLQAGSSKDHVTRQPNTAARKLESCGGRRNDEIVPS